MHLRGKVRAAGPPTLDGLRSRSFPFGAFLLALALTWIFPAPAASAETVKMGGSGANLGTMRLLAEAFEKSHPGVRFTIFPSLGSSGGISALMDGAVDIALLSRPLKERERAKGVTAVEYGRSPFVIVTAKKDAPPSFTLQQLAAIYGGSVTSWPDGSPLRLVLRPRGDSDTDALEGMSPAMRSAVRKAHHRKGLIIATSDQENADAIQKIPGAMGTSTLAIVLSEKRPLKPLSLGGVDPTPGNLANGTYPFFKRLFMAVGPKKPSLAVRQFVEFARSPEGRRILAETGHWAR